MKIDARNPMHWGLLFLSGFWVMLAICLRPLRRPLRRGSGKRVILYGHKLGGNLLAIHRYLKATPDDVQTAFLTMDPAYHRELLANGEPSVLATSFRCLPWLVGADALISDHGLHALQPLLSMSDMKFFDAWHAIPFKGFNHEDFRVLHRYTETWVPSPLLAELYVDLYGFPRERVVVTGYARTDRLVRDRNVPRAHFRNQIGLPSDAGEVILFAPTWKQDSLKRSLFPFDTDGDEFCQALSRLAARIGATVVLRTHLNSGREGIDVARYERLVNIPYADNPDTEAILLATDLLVCDWSSIAFDYLLLDRPTVFLDVPAPFRKGFTLGPEYRYGEIVADLHSMVESVERYILAPARYLDRYGDLANSIKRDVYGRFADGNASARCAGRLAANIAG